MERIAKNKCPQKERIDRPIVSVLFFSLLLINIYKNGLNPLQSISLTIRITSAIYKNNGFYLVAVVFYVAQTEQTQLQLNLLTTNEKIDRDRSHIYIFTIKRQAIKVWP